jgi:hypothetical protein
MPDPDLPPLRFKSCRHLEHGCQVYLAILELGNLPKRRETLDDGLHVLRNSRGRHLLRGDVEGSEDVC